jgi:crotonobetainyl-CoA:carnitine CoA-transferase CaiB-like acyl-CoA transferase
VRPLDDITVVETGAGLAPAFAGKLLGDLGARVIRFAPAQDALAAAPAGSVQQALAQYLHGAKDTRAEGRGGFDEALAGAAIWIDGRDARMVAEDVRTLQHRDGRQWPGLTHVAITPFGLDGPWRDHPGSGFIASAVGGFLYLCGEPDREPLRNGGHLPEFQTGLFAALGAVAGLFATESGQPGRLVDLSLLESVIAFHERGDLSVTHLGRDITRSRRHEATHPFTILPCKDGFVTLAVGTPRQWQNLCVLLGKPEWADDPEFLLNRLAHYQEIDEVLLPWLATQTAAEFTTVCQELFIACGPVLTPSQALADAHLAERQFWRTFGVDGRTLSAPGLPIRVAGRPLDLPEAVSR